MAPSEKEKKRRLTEIGGGLVVVGWWWAERLGWFGGGESAFTLITRCEPLDQADGGKYSATFPARRAVLKRALFFLMPVQKAAWEDFFNQEYTHTHSHTPHLIKVA